MSLTSYALSLSLAASSLFGCQVAAAQTYASPNDAFNHAPQVTYTSPAPAAPMPHSSGQVTTGLAQQKAGRAASTQIHGHIGGGLGGAAYEGVGWSNQSAQKAIQNCCYWGTRPVSQIGVARAANGCWYACVLYQ